MAVSQPMNRQTHGDRQMTAQSGLNQRWMSPPSSKKKDVSWSLQSTWGQ
uniref:Uncharacterized protein n=1 Tax=Anguilla anguilla TaxID=7936 RepID=A0A0E9QE66_ANGAN